MKFLLFPLISIVVFAASGSNARAIRLNPFVDIASQPKDTCEVHAQVRAEDLSPDHISHGELRIKVPRTQCAQQIASVALRLQLDEFTEVKFLKNGAVPSDVNKSSPAWMSDPELWTIGAEERRAWVTEANLLADNPDFSRPIVTPFTVAVPAVNYPPAVDRYRNWYSPILRHSFSDLGYRYIAVVTFSDGRSVDVPAGHTTFVPTVHASPEQAPFTWNATFAEWSTSRCGDDSPEEKKRADELERCLPEAQRSAFVAEVTLESGNVVTKGSPIKGRVTVHNTNGSTSMSHISVHLRTVQRDHSAQAQAAAGGDIHFYNATSCIYSGGERALHSESSAYSHIFDDWNNFDDWNYSQYDSYSPITPSQPYFDFVLPTSPETPTDFTSYYAYSASMLHLSLTVLYSQDVAECVDPPELPKDESSMEERLWDSYTPVRQTTTVSTYSYYQPMRLQVVVPLTVVDGGLLAAATQRPIAHYLTPGLLPAPVLRPGAQDDLPEFPLAQPVITVEPIEDTTARLMPNGSYAKNPGWEQLYTDIDYMPWFLHDAPDPTKDYRGGNYAGLLWKKKVVAEEWGVSAVPSEVLEEENDVQRNFAT